MGQLEDVLRRFELKKEAEKRVKEKLSSKVSLAIEERLIERELRLMGVKEEEIPKIMELRVSLYHPMDQFSLYFPPKFRYH
ncbi:MAG: hypothetical protein J7L59_02665 [Nanoarchaeota archaeon]|nr:hypothetical protein [Nanoarchaeota archaeon]